MRVFILLSFVGLLFGCGNIAIKNEHIAQIKKVEISTNVEYGAKAHNNGPSQGLAMLFQGGALGASYSRAANDERNEMTYIIQEHSKLDKVAYNAFKQALQKDSVWGSKIDNGRETPDATIYLNIYYYGFNYYDFLADGAKPAFGLIATMIDKNGNVIWKRGRGISEYIEGLPRYTVVEYLSDISRYEEACEHLAAKLIDTYFMPTLNDD